jgi:hypothetical protein
MFTFIFIYSLSYYQSTPHMITYKVHAYTLSEMHHQQRHVPYPSSPLSFPRKAGISSLFLRYQLSTEQDEYLFKHRASRILIINSFPGISTLHTQQDISQGKTPPPSSRDAPESRQSRIFPSKMQKSLTQSLTTLKAE